MNEIKYLVAIALRLYVLPLMCVDRYRRFSSGEKTKQTTKKQIPEPLHHVGMVRVVNKHVCNGSADLAWFFRRNFSYQKFHYCVDGICVRGTWCLRRIWFYFKLSHMKTKASFNLFFPCLRITTVFLAAACWASKMMTRTWARLSV